MLDDPKIFKIYDIIKSLEKDVKELKKEVMELKSAFKELSK